MMDSTSNATSTPIDHSDHGELQQWITDNDDLSPEDKERYRELNANI